MKCRKEEVNKRLNHKEQKKNSGKKETEINE